MTTTIKTKPKCSLLGILAKSEDLWEYTEDKKWQILPHDRGTGASSSVRSVWALLPSLSEAA